MFGWLKRRKVPPRSAVDPLREWPTYPFGWVRHTDWLKLVKLLEDARAKGVIDIWHISLGPEIISVDVSCNRPPPLRHWNSQTVGAVIRPGNHLAERVQSVINGLTELLSKPDPWA